MLVFAVVMFILGVGGVLINNKMLIVILTILRYVNLAFWRHFIGAYIRVSVHSFTQD